ncbi:MAG: hypothetical protein WCB51_03230 [Candidatus Dormiibacterota bacterium]
MDANSPTPDRRRAALGLVAVVVVVAAGGLVISLAQPHSRVATPTPVTAFTGPVVGLGFSVAYDLLTRQVVVFGGLDSESRTWLLKGRDWTLATPGTSPAGRSGATAAYDPESQTVMLFGGSLASGTSANDTWSWDGTTWHELDSGLHGPPAGQGAQMAWDDAPGEGVMVLVTDAETGTGGETWTWNGTDWTRAVLGDLTVNLFGDVMAYDPTTQTLALVTPVSPDDEASLLMSWDGVRWRLLTTNGPPIRGMAVNPQIHTLLACEIAAYSTSLDAQDSCWEWTGFRWVELRAAAPPDDSRQLMIEDEVADPITARILMFGWLTRAIPGRPQPLHVWSWDGEVWRLLA